MSESDLQRWLDRTSREVERLRVENEPKTETVALTPGQRMLLSTPAPAAAKKVALIRSLFRGREDVYAVRWESARTGKSSQVAVQRTAAGS